MRADETVYYREVQRFRQIWLWVIVIAIDILMVSTFSYDFYQRIFLGRTVDEPMSAAEAWITWMLLGIVLPFLITALFLSKLVVEVTEQGVSIRYFPFVRRRIPYADIASRDVCQFSPFWDFGGWGIRWFPGGWAYIVSGNRGVKLRLNDNKLLIIGSHHPEKLAEAIAEAMGDRRDG
ncbi:hypothetical protein A6764_01935 [Brevibacillus sp. WF146]|uniref:hypothetical protein n=1 Tax=Brevibacillus sp. WF146 TaxID=319501 RepID=UPI0007EDEBB2|nr:hypothetical protein [Brevibacillus sp. WF146]UYZ13769.1 hypothetical protein A6764_01935 [Brevibacillus sp. WF146]